MFIGGAPRNCATKMFAGRSYTSCAVPPAAARPCRARRCVHRHRLDLVVGHVDDRLEPLVEVDEFGAPRRAALRRGSTAARPWGEDEVRCTIARASATRCRPPDSGTRLAVEEVDEAEDRRRPHVAFCPLPFDAAPSAELDVRLHGLVRIERIPWKTIATSRSRGATCRSRNARRSRSRRRSVSRSAIMRSTVDLPQPDGPSRTRNSWRRRRAATNRPRRRRRTAGDVAEPHAGHRDAP